jgi:hypothetical protein
MEKINALKELVATAEKDAGAFYDKGNKAAGTRLRNALQLIKVLATNIRKDVIAKKNGAKQAA